MKKLMMISVLALTSYAQAENDSLKTNPQQFAEETIAKCAAELKNYCSDLSSYQRIFNHKPPHGLKEPTEEMKVSMAKMECLSLNYESFDNGQCRDTVETHENRRFEHFHHRAPSNDEDIDRGSYEE